MAANQSEVKRGPHGRFLKGSSPISPGRPAVVREFRERCQAFMEEKGWGIVESLAIREGRDQIRAAELIAAYAYGKPPQKLEHGGDPENPTPITYHEIVQVSSEPK